ncbi:MAG: putative quinol monooxygenase [Solirubrobacterales bacterium]
MAFALISYWTARDGEEEAVAAAVAQMVAPSRAEPGNLRYQVHRDPEDARRFVFYELYVDEAAYVAHGESEHFQRYAVGDALDRLASREREFLYTWEPG